MTVIETEKRGVGKDETFIERALSRQNFNASLAWKTGNKMAGENIGSDGKPVQKSSVYTLMKQHGKQAISNGIGSKRVHYLECFHTEKNTQEHAY